MDTYESRRNRDRDRKGGARARYEARKRRREDMAVRPDDEGRKRGAQVATGTTAETLSNLMASGQVLLRDFWWYITHNGMIVRGVAVVAVLLFVIYFMTTMLRGGIMSGVESMGVDMGGMSQMQAEAALQETWDADYNVQLVANGRPLREVAPASMGVNFDAMMTADIAGDAGLDAFPFGKTVDPVVTFDRLTAQNFLLDLSTEINTLPVNASYELSDGVISGIPGYEGYVLNVGLTLERMDQSLANIVQRRRFELVMDRLDPDVRDPQQFMPQVQALVAANPNPQLVGYDPYKNEILTWPMRVEDVLSWISVSPVGLTLRDENFQPYVSLLNDTLNPDGRDLRYLDNGEIARIMRQSLAEGRLDAELRIRYKQTVYNVEPGDTLFAISRKTGIPYFLIEEANPDINPDFLSPGDPIAIPTRDVTMSAPPVANKRIIVDLEQQYMVAYENNEVVFEWSISSGVDTAPTSPGIYQILTHEEVAYGSSATLCDDVTLVCGQWEMSWFMGIYEVVPGLLNGFHGEVLLPNGNYLGAGAIGSQTTFGCVMSEDDKAKALYDWAEIGTVVEIISDEYAPYSDLARITHARLEGGGSA